MKVIVNADDFGYSSDTVRATIDCLEQGAVTSATIMPGMPAVEEALAYARSAPEVSFGVHLTFSGDSDERPICDPREIPGLVMEDGRLPPKNSVRLRAVFGRVSVDEIEQEIEAQIKAIIEGGVRVSHIDSHHHVHKLAPFRRALRRVLPRFRINRVRNVQDVYLRRPFASPTFWLGRVWRRDLMSDFQTTDHFYSPSSAGDLDWEADLVLQLARLKGPVLEIGLHPGFEEAWRSAERSSAWRFADSARELGHELVSWHGLPGGSSLRMRNG